MRAKLVAAIAVPTAALAAAVLIPVGSGAFSGSELFKARVNGLESGATVTVVCPGAATSGAVKAGQTWSVESTASTADGQVGGGNGSHEIVAAFNGIGTGPTTTFLAFGSIAIPTSPANVPCSGSGTVTFQTTGNGHRNDTVSVNFVGVPS